MNVENISSDIVRELTVHISEREWSKVMIDWGTMAAWGNYGMLQKFIDTVDQAMIEKAVKRP